MYTADGLKVQNSCCPLSAHRCAQQSPSPFRPILYSKPLLLCRYSAMEASQKRERLVRFTGSDEVRVNDRRYMDALLEKMRREDEVDFLVTFSSLMVIFLSMLKLQSPGRATLPSVYSENQSFLKRRAKLCCWSLLTCHNYNVWSQKKKKKKEKGKAELANSRVNILQHILVVTHTMFALFLFCCCCFVGGVFPRSFSWVIGIHGLACISGSDEESWREASWGRETET